MKRLSTFEIWLRRGRIVEEPQLIETKSNPWHDPEDIASAITIYYLRPENRFHDAADRANIAEAIIRAAVRR